MSPETSSQEFGVNPEEEPRFMASLERRVQTVVGLQKIINDEALTPTTSIDEVELTFNVFWAKEKARFSPLVLDNFKKLQELLEKVTLKRPTLDLDQPVSSEEQTLWQEIKNLQADPDVEFLAMMEHGVTQMLVKFRYIRGVVEVFNKAAEGRRRGKGDENRQHIESVLGACFKSGAFNFRKVKNAFVGVFDISLIIEKKYLDQEIKQLSSAGDLEGLHVANTPFSIIADQGSEEANLAAILHEEKRNFFESFLQPCYGGPLWYLEARWKDYQKALAGRGKTPHSEATNQRAILARNVPKILDNLHSELAAHLDLAEEAWFNEKPVAPLAASTPNSEKSWEDIAKFWGPAGKEVSLIIDFAQKSAREAPNDPLRDFFEKLSHDLPAGFLALSENIKSILTLARGSEPILNEVKALLWLLPPSQYEVIKKYAENKIQQRGV